MKLNLVFRCQVERINFQGKKYDELLSLLFLFYKSYSLFYNMNHSISEAFKQQGRVITALHPTLDPGWSQPSARRHANNQIHLLCHRSSPIVISSSKQTFAFLSFFFSSTQRLASDGFTMT